MTLFEYLIRNSNEKCIVSPLAKLCSEKLQYSRDIDLLDLIYKDFSPYSLELTISPKSSSVIHNECASCGSASLRDLDQQSEIMYSLLNELLETYKINILGVTEIYSDGKTLHTHNIISPIPISIRTKILRNIQSHYKLYNNYVVRLSPVMSLDKYNDYLKKDLEEGFAFHYYGENKEYTEMRIEKEKIKQDKIDKYQKEQEIIYSDPIKYHLHYCVFENCPICQWIQGRNV